MIDINQTQGSFSLKGTCNLRVAAKSFCYCMKICFSGGGGGGVVQKLTLSTE